MWIRATLTPGVVAVLLLVGAPAYAAADPVDRVITDSRIVESSGLAASPGHSGVLWTLNDSGDTARIFAVGRDGSTVATYTVTGLVPRDWEAIAASRSADGAGVLWIGDIGDNSGRRTNGILVHRVTEPARLLGGSVRPTSYRLRYPDGPRDAEALLVHPRTGRVYVVSKGLLGGEVYRAPARLRTDAPNLLERVRAAPSIVTDGVFLADGRAVLLSYGSLSVYDSLDDDDSERSRLGVSVPDSSGEPSQMESIADAGDGRSVLVGSEGRRSSVVRVTLPQATSTTATPSVAPAAGEADEDTPGGRGSVLLGGLAVAAVLGFLLYAARRR